MSNYIVKDTELTSVANAIRIKGGTNSQLVFPDGFVSAIGNISGGGGSSDFSTAEVTFISVSDTYGANATTVDNDSLKHETYEVSPQNPVTVTVPLYKGKNILPITCIQGNDQSYMPTTEGSIVFDLDSFGYIVTGNGSITAKGRSIG
jgi:hypothetical protein